MGRKESDSTEQLNWTELKAEKEKEWNIDTCCNVDEPHSHYTEWKKPDTKDYILWNPEIKHRMVVDRGLGGMGSDCWMGIERWFLKKVMVTVMCNIINVFTTTAVCT